MYVNFEKKKYKKSCTDQVYGQSHFLDRKFNRNEKIKKIFIHKERNLNLKQKKKNVRREMKQLTQEGKIDKTAKFVVLLFVAL